MTQSIQNDVGAGSRAMRRETSGSTLTGTARTALQWMAASVPLALGLTLWVLTLAWARPAHAQCPTPSFGAATTFPAAHGTVAPADYDVDGTADMAVGDVVIYGDGNGGFGSPVSVLNVRAMAAVDLGGVTPPIPGVNNAAPELVAESTANPTRVLVGLGSGSRGAPFSLLAGFPVWGSPPLSAVVADLTGDGIPDLVIGYGPPANELVIWIGAGTSPNWSNRIPPVELPFVDPVALAVGDFDDDGRVELLALSGSGNALVEFKYINQSFISQSVTVSGGPTGLAVADLDGDGLLDAVISTASGDVVSLLGTGIVIGHGIGFGSTFGTPRKVSLGGGLAGVALGDMNGDQRTDAVVVDRMNRQVIPLLGDGTGAFTAAAPLATGTSAPTSVALADLNHDGSQDIVSGDAIDPNVSVRLNTCPVSPVDIQVTGMEVTQGVQDLNNDVVLVADRPTFVRLYVRASVPIDGVMARLSRADANGNAIERPIWPSNPGGSIAVKTSPDRKVFQDSFLFELPPSWTALGTLHLTAIVNPAHLPIETTFANNTRMLDATFQSTNPVKIELIKIRYRTGPGSGTECNNEPRDATDADLDEAESALRRELPAAKFVFTRPAGVWDSGLTMDCTINIAPGEESKVFLDALTAAYASQPLDRIRLGIHRRQAIGGIADAIPGWFAVSQFGAPKTPVHEIGHTLGRFHVVSPLTPPCSAISTPGGLDRQYPYPSGAIGGPASDPERFVGFDPGDASIRPWPPLRRIIPPTAGDLMGYCRESWPSDYTWTGLRTGINAKFPPNDPAGDFLRVSGEVEPSGMSVSRLSAVRLPSVGAVAPSLPGKFHLRQLGPAGSVLSDLAFSPRPDHGGQPTEIAETINFAVGTRRIVIFEPGGATIGAISVSAHPPGVGSITLSSGKVLPASGPVTVSWIASDADGDALLADLLWSRDGGKTFSPVASGITGSSYTLEASQLAGTGAQAAGVLRVFVRDPVLSAIADETGFTARGTGPRVRIVAPFAGQGFVRGQTVVLRTIASDVEDGVLDGAVTWSSDRDGQLGTSANIAAQLSIGSHILTARVVDSSGNVATATTTVTVYGVLPPGKPPIAVAGKDQQVVEGATVTLDGHGSSDPDGDPVIYVWRLIEAPPSVTGIALNGSGPVATFRAPDSGTYRFELTVSDNRQGASTDTVKVTVGNVAPSVTILSPAAGAVFLAGPVTVDAAFTDPGLVDTHTCAVTWDADTAIPAVPGSLSEIMGSCSATRTLSAGVYTVRVAVRDNDGGEGTASVQLVVVDPRAGSVSGHGQFASPKGALTSDPSASGKAVFEFDSAYKHDASHPTGETEFRFGRFHFRSTSYDWLVVTGAKTQFRGAGVVNRKPGYEFLLTAYDGDPNGSCRDDEGHHHKLHADRFRLKVWSRTTGAVLYDNVPWAPDDIDSASPEAISTGCIEIKHPRRHR